MFNSRSDRTRTIFILGLLCCVGPFTIDTYLPAFEEIARDLHTTVAEVSLSLSSYFIGVAFGQLVYGPFLDRFGRKRPLYFGLTLFLISCIGCVLVTSVQSLIALRFIQALGGCAAQVTSLTFVRDLFPEKERSKVFSLLMLILGISPLVAPTVGSLVSHHYGWRAVFVVLFLMGLLILTAFSLYMKDPHKADASISLRPLPIFKNYLAIIKQPQFFTYVFSGAFSFSGLYVYLAGSPIIFMKIFKVTPGVYSAIFAILASGFIGGNQVNILLLKKFRSEQIFRTAQKAQVVLALLFCFLAHANLLNVYLVILFFFLNLACLGHVYPNGAALAIAPFSKNAGSASALLGFLQMGIGAVASSTVGIFHATSVAAILSILTGASVFALFVHALGQVYIKRMKSPGAEVAL